MVERWIDGYRVEATRADATVIVSIYNAFGTLLDQIEGYSVNRLYRAWCKSRRFTPDVATAIGELWEATK